MNFFSLAVWMGMYPFLIFVIDLVSIEFGWRNSFYGANKQTGLTLSQDLGPTDNNTHISYQLE